MFATLNHNKLVATVRSEATGYKKYDFRFLRPDGFDGTLQKYVHKDKSPYNKSVNDDDIQDALVDESTFFERVFGGLWEKPDDYDPQEVEYTQRRTVEDPIYDYYMFRFGLDGFSDKEQKKHYLKKGVVEGANAYSMPQYENSFYFYFGLKDGSTALDEFKKQFFSECEANKLARTPSINVQEDIDPDTFECKGKLIIDNMMPTYSITITDNTIGGSGSVVSFSEENDTVNIDEWIKLDVGHEYTITVNDSVEQTATKTFVYGASAVEIEARTVHFRRGVSGQTKQASIGGYVAINDELTILKRKMNISGGSIQFEIMRYDDNGVEVPVEESSNPGGYSVSNYTDTENVNWHLFYLPQTGKYNFYIQYSGNTISVYTTTMDNNAKINLFVSCDYLAYKPAFKEHTESGGIFYDCYPGGLKSLTDTQLHNGEPFKGNGNTDANAWLMRHSFYRQTENDRYAYDNYIYTKGNYEIALFGQPENGSLISNGTLHTGGTFYRGDYDLYAGYNLDDKYAFYPTMYWSGGSEDPSVVNGRNMFDVMAYSDDGRAAADTSKAVITSYTHNNGVITLRCRKNGETALTLDHGCVVVFENGSMLFPVVKNESTNIVTMVAYSDDIYPNVENVPEDILAMAAVYPTMHVPEMYKPFYGKVTAATWNVQALTLATDEMGVTAPEKTQLPLSYKVEGKIYNGLSFNNKFYSGETASTGEVQTYDTYLNFQDDSSFWSYLGTTSSADSTPRRELTFGIGSIDSGVCREVVDLNNSAKTLNSISYAVKEGIPNSMSWNSVYTERYANKEIDQFTLSDSCNVENEFYMDLSVKVNGTSGGNVDSFEIYSSDQKPQNMKMYRTTTQLFNKSSEPLSVSDGSNVFYYGTYNANAKNDIKGSLAIVKGVGTYKYQFSITQESGAKITKTANSVDELFNSGVTLAYKYTLSNSAKTNLSNIANLISDANEISVASDTSGGTPFEGGFKNYKMLIAVYTRPYNGSKNEMTVYRLYPIEDLQAMYPPEDGGVAPYLNPPPPVTATKWAQTVQLEVSTNVSFTASSNATSWLTLPAGTTYGPESPSVVASLSENTGTTTRKGIITFRSVEPGVDEISGKTEITQTIETTSTTTQSGNTGGN